MTTFDNTLYADGALIVGAGLAGLFTALKLAPRPVTVLSPKPLGTGASSAWAQGGVAAAMGEGDSPHAHAQDTEMAGAGIVDHGTAEGVTAEAVARIEDLARWGTPFDRDDFGNFELGREAAHSANRIVKVEGDRAGRAIMQAIIAQVRRTPSIRVVEGITALSLARENGRVVGVYCRKLGDRYSEPIFVRARATVLAAGGLGGLYAVTTNPPGVRGHAMGMAARAGAVIADPEFVQFHPTAIATGADPAPLATEALRGEGAILVNDRGERFMPAIHPDAELAPRDIVARANFRQIQAGRRVFLDTREVLGAAILTRFPTVSKYCRDAGIDPVAEMIPVTPAAHFHMGGVKVDERGRSSLPGLWVCGEASCTGLHGANRLASNSLLEAVVYGARIAEDIGGLEPAGQLAPFKGIEWDEAEGNRAEEVLRNSLAVQQLRGIMTNLVGVERHREGLQQALRDIAVLEAQAEQVTTAYLNMTTSATMVAAAALKRTESRGGHFRTDFPEPDPRWEHHTEMTLGEALALRAASR
ncbi:L-aspartate oxidase [Devosia sp. 63-57]|uniref:L-aspartate oxidase n=1 Tax=Devosia sp. 63-57 TaxID=1895751 RepID=UPI00086A9EE6|nr:L-aspartate oxidase [Devosia sp. 63-57]ODT49004.1 MAG: L-aspartate oxidase [Pelagibacterium sp. SCN 63-126]ODU82989.1 MAG: L-aspartate oxidase [Pelagibacterium sp. SCN 63-17]OJX44065.1 MAG: L-aspartate oxidase [Devosia sp. 63-57]